MARRVGFPRELIGTQPGVFADPGQNFPVDWSPRGRWYHGPLHTFCDDYRQEFFWRRPDEGRIIAFSAGFVTAPDFSVYSDDPDEWARYQVWRSALIGAYWAEWPVQVLPVVAFRGDPGRFVAKGSAWAVRGPGREQKRRQAWHEGFSRFCGECEPGLVLVFGNAPEHDYRVRLDLRNLVSSKVSCTK